MEVEQILLARQEEEIEELAEMYYREEIEVYLLEEMYEEHRKKPNGNPISDND